MSDVRDISDDPMRNIVRTICMGQKISWSESLEDRCIEAMESLECRSRERLIDVLVETLDAKR